MIEGNIFELKWKKRRQAIIERVLYILSDYKTYLIIAGIILLLMQFNLINNQCDLLQSIGGHSFICK